MHQLLLQVLQRAVVDVDWTPQLCTLTGTLLGHLPAEIDVKVGLEGHRELDSFFVSWIWNKKKNRTLTSIWKCTEFSGLDTFRHLISK